MFKVSGATVYPSEVEQALRGIDGIDNAFVTKVVGAHGDRVGAVVVCDTTAMTIEGLRDAARKRLSSFKVPAVWLLVDSDEELPRGPTGKVDIGRLRDLLAAQNSPRDLDESRSHRNGATARPRLAHARATRATS